MTTAGYRSQGGHRPPIPLATVRTTARVVTTDAGEEGFGRFDCRSLGLGHHQGCTCSREARPLMVSGEQPVVTDALETGR